ncbi:hypothetical protein HQ397_03995 [Aeromonas hydrophila]|uniref:hypothetical protein n=1 Tax=Aeromonas hydrophila TaxID=644 RepID=UPI001C77F2D8|nr:hypothetical protein [Aeromonas hydrophila]QWL69371.1 hypothetical protein HQ397_03995 [Aeromonas hydrophila]
MSKDTDGVNFVTDDNTGGYYVCECQSCGEVFSSRDCGGGGQIADTGDYDDAYCPHCGQVDPLECDNPALVWNVQQKKINELLAALEEIAGSDPYHQSSAGTIARAAIAKAKGGEA